MDPQPGGDSARCQSRASTDLAHAERASRFIRERGKQEEHPNALPSTQFATLQVLDHVQDESLVCICNPNNARHGCEPRLTSCAQPSIARDYHISWLGTVTCRQGLINGFLIRHGANQDRLEYAVLPDRGRELIQCRAVVVQAAVRRFGSLGDGVDPDEDHADIVRHLRRLGPDGLNGGRGVPAKRRPHQTTVGVRLWTSKPPTRRETTATWRANTPHAPPD